MATSTVMDEYYLELEKLDVAPDLPKPIRAMAYSTADSSQVAETEWGLEETKKNLLLLLQEPNLVENHMHHLDEYRQVILEPLVFSLKNLQDVGFNPDDLQP